MSLSVQGGVLRLHEFSTGRHILALLEELNRSQWLSRDELLARQRDKLISLVEYADRYVPYYQRVFKEVGFRPDDLRQDLSTLNRIPILNKPIIRKNWDDLLTTEPERRRRMSQAEHIRVNRRAAAFHAGRLFSRLCNCRAAASYELVRLEIGRQPRLDLYCPHQTVTARKGAR